MIDHRYPDKIPSKWVCITFGFISAYTALASGSIVSSDPAVAATLAMFVLGLITGPAIAPPVYIDKTEYPKLISRIVEQVKGKISGAIFLKIVALIVGFWLSLFTGYWYWLIAIFCCFLIFAKGASIALSLSHDPSGHPDADVTWIWFKKAVGAIMCFVAIWSAGPFIVFSEINFVPTTFGAFVGVGFAGLLVGFEN